MYNGTGDESGLGVDTSDDKTIVFNLKEPCAYFEQLFVLPVYMPTHRELQTETNGDWAMGNDMDALVSCGPYYLADMYRTSTAFIRKMKITFRQTGSKPIRSKKWLWTIHSPSSMRINPVS